MPDTPRLIHILSSSFWGGREEYALDICRGFSEMGWRVSVFTRDMAAIDTPFRAHGVRVRHLPLRGYADLATVVSLSHHLRHTDALTVVHTHKYRDAFLALLARKLSRRRDVRVVLTCHRVRPGRDTWLARRICRNLHALVFVSVWPGTRSCRHGRTGCHRFRQTVCILCTAVSICRGRVMRRCRRRGRR